MSSSWQRCACSTWKRWNLYQCMVNIEKRSVFLLMGIRYSCIYIYIYIYVQIYHNTYGYIHIVYILIYTYWYIHVGICILICVYIYIYIFIHTFTGKKTECSVNRFWHGHPSPTFAVGSIYSGRTPGRPLVSDRKTGRALS